MFRRKFNKVILSILVATIVSSTNVFMSGTKAQAAIGNLSENDTIYQIMVDRFYDGDKTNNATGDAFRNTENLEDDFRYMHGGDWQGIIDKLDYIKDMGYSAIWISPVAEPQMWSRADSTGKVWPTAYHGYNVKDPNKANPYFGTKEKLKELVDKAHEKGIKVIIDIVPNHVGDYMSGKQAYYDIKGFEPAAPFNNPNWYHHNGDIDWSREHSDPQMLEDHDLGGLDDLDQDNSDAKAAMNNAIKSWFDYTGADAARVDAAKCMKPSYINELQKYIGVNTFGENFDMNVDFVKKWVGSNAEWGMLDFPLYQAINNDFASGQSFDDMSSSGTCSIKNILAQDNKYNGYANHMVTFIDNHDRNRFLTVANGNVKKLQNALVFMFTVRGVPTVFQGTEQNKGNGNGAILNGIADTWNRWSMVKKDYNGNVITDYFNENTDTYKLISKLNSFRQKYEALREGTQREMWSSPHLYAFSRRMDSGENVGQEVVNVFNNSDGDQSATIPIRAESTIKIGDKLVNLFDVNDSITVQQGGVTGKQISVNLGENSGKIYVVNNETPNPDQKNVQYKVLYKNTNAKKVTLHYGTNGWKNIQDVNMTKNSNGEFEATITVNNNDILNYCIHIISPTDYWDNNGGQNWNVKVTKAEDYINDGVKSNLKSVNTTTSAAIESGIDSTVNR
ncbi:alpha-amylase family glycosyl hydrolase [Clostridium sp. YIM B02555]|uniref:alpha-amylase family glycosyl hydrolase n=1 Tax=Clostridium sp. YIM B02555 TaxID=2911968 RepID=UPI001EEF42F4|nr:alpha-amylase family glycosyl hydrolase [Clostridium sp. YIM B02555]